ncbi:hypothetical protein, partial [Rhodoferax sp.]|uniref:hypothetical protein n=1 Tax=Rhodoferax sp. TaxID=50421 RepID=UPI0025F73799
LKNPKTRNFQTGSVSVVGEITERMLHYQSLLGESPVCPGSVTLWLGKVALTSMGAVRTTDPSGRTRWTRNATGR